MSHDHTGSRVACYVGGILRSRRKMSHAHTGSRFACIAGGSNEQQPLSLHLCACISKGGVVATVHMRMKPPFPNPGSATASAP